MAMRPDSSTLFSGLFGYPVRHSVSPQIHNAAFEAAGLNWVYLSFPVKPEDLGKALGGSKALGMVGLNVTIPHKEAIIPLLDELSDEAREIGAVNTVRFEKGRAKGYNTDGRGFAAALMEAAAFSFPGKTILLLGAGGAGRAVAVQAAREGACRIFISDLRKEKADGLKEWVNRRAGKNLAFTVNLEDSGGKMVLTESDLVVNATPLGLKAGDPLPFDPAPLPSSALVMDLVYNPPVTPLLEKARLLGLTGVGGMGMLVHQAAFSWEIWTGLLAPVEVMREAARSALRHGIAESE